MVRRDTIVVGASAGGVEALRTLAAGLPPGLLATVLIVLHVPPTGVNALPSILARGCALPVRSAQSNDVLQPGQVLVARPDHHLLVVDGRVLLTRGPRENGHRPAVDVLFRSAARALGPRVLGVVLSGALDDGSAGLVAVRTRGGVGIVQDPKDALHAGMPTNAIAAAQPEFVLPVAEIPGVLSRLVGTEADWPSDFSPSDLVETEVAVAEMEPKALHDMDRPGIPSGLSCPDCHGVLFEIEEEGFLRYRCRVGHAWSVESLLSEHGAAMESALWMALRTLEEKAALARELGSRAKESDQPISAARFDEQAQEALEAADIIRTVLERADTLIAEQDPPPGLTE